MHPFYQAALDAACLALTDLDATLADLPDGALDWAPAPGTNAITVLVRHSLSATPFLFATAAGRNPDRDAYRKGDRAEAFAAQGGASALLRRDVQAAEATLMEILSVGDDAALKAVAPWGFDDGRSPTGARFLVHAVGHLREHVGQVQLMRDLWNAKSA